ncbi:hypothetical protein DV736_g787, partial [Chaetothyriales sp. CBS 134916]
MAVTTTRTPQNTPATNAPISSHAQAPNLGGIAEEDLDRAAAASIFAKNPALVSMMQAKLGSLVGRSSGYIETLPAPVQRRIDGLKGIQKDHQKLEAQFQEEVLQLEKKYFSKYTPLYEKRAAIVNGQTEPTEEEVVRGQADDTEDDGVRSQVYDGEHDEGDGPDKAKETAKGVPEFWLTAMKQHPSISEIITDRDEEALSALTNVRMEYLDRPGFKLIFEFGPNSFFTNKTISKTYLYREENGYGGDFIYDHAEGDKIDWEAGKDLTVRVESKKQRNKNTKQTRVVKKTVPTESFFNFFKPPVSPTDGDDDIDEDIEERLELDYQLGEDFKEKLIPHAVDWFTGDALQYEGSPPAPATMASWAIGTRAWFPNQAEGFIPGELVERKGLGEGKIGLRFQLADESFQTVDTTEAALNGTGPSTSLPPLMNPYQFEAAEDLTSLSHLNEPAILQAIKLRYAQKEIYTYSGIVLIATNPFARVDSLYVPQMVQIYTGKQRQSQAPHLFAIAEEAYIDMLRKNINQTVVVSGESGAGKTVSAKYIMRYFATRGSPSEALKGSKSRLDALSKIEEQILATNPVMEAFGNAKTTRNDNSSRFGKYIEIMFDSNTDIIGARIRTYLLERSRLVFQPLKERNYHVFYQLVAGATEAERQDFGLLPVEQFDYMNQGTEPVLDGVDDAAEFAGTRKSLTTIGLAPETQAEIWRVLAALLHLGNIKITAARNESAHLSSSDPSLVRACDMLGLDAANFSKWLVKKQLVTREGAIISNLVQQQATVVRDSVAKFIYSSLFDWLVHTINQGLATPEVMQRLHTFIGVLDIYGFEHFAKNSFEQFCINYANEKLQQEFNQHVFKLEQEEYMREEIDWTFIDFADNQPCIDLIEGKLGILALLDEESRLPMGSDSGLIKKLHHTFLDKQAFYKKPRFGQTAFTVCHYALDVTYESDGFIEKNRDTVPDEQMEVLRQSSSRFLVNVLQTATELREKESTASSATRTMANGPNKRVGSAASRKPTLGGIFKSSLIELMHTINSTDAHYIRCIKPNEAKEAWKFEGPMVLSQLRACGVLETVRISTAGYPTRWTYEEFALRYYMLCHSSEWTTEIQTMAQNILRKVLGDVTRERGDKYQTGKTKIFFRQGMLAFLEDKRSARLKESAIMIQKNLRAKYYRKQYLAIRESIIQVQSATRAFLARRQADEVRQAKAATTIQRVWRGQKERKDYNATRNNIIRFQSLAKGYMLRKNMMETRYRNAATTIQRSWRSYSAVKNFRQHRKKVVIIQNLWRGKKARLEYKTMREEARDLKQISYKLENKVVELTQSLGALKRENKTLLSQLENYESQIKSWRSRHNAVEARNRELQTEANQAGIVAAQLSALEDEHSKLQTSHDEHMGNAKRLQEEQRRLTDSLTLSNQELDTLKKANVSHESDKVSLRQQINELQDQLDMAKRAAPAPAVNGEYTNGNPPQPAAVNGIINLVSSKKPLKRRSAGAAERSETDRYSGAFSARPVSMAMDPHTKTMSGSTFNPGLDSVEMELENLLAQEDELNDEVTMGLIRSIKIPLPGANPPPTDKEVLFPSYLINLVTSEMWNNGFVKESERFLANVMQSIQQEVMQHEGDEAINPGAFWLSNVHEMLSFVFLAEDWYEAQKTDNYEYDRLLEIVKHDLESLEFNIYHTWMKVLKKKLHKMIVPAIIESQSLPGFVTNENNRFLGKLLPSNNTPAYSMDNLLSLLNNVFKAMKAFYLEDSIITQTVTELLRLVGVTAFNDLLMRRNFLSWKRGLQINYNITRIEEWCKGHDMPEGTLQLEHLMQATKLLQLKKATLNDIEIIQDICWMLSPNQIQKLLNQYLVADYEQPINGEIMKAVASRVTEKSDVLLLAPVDMEDSGPYEIAEPRVITALETYTPSWLQTPRLKRLAEIVSAQAMAQQEQGIDADMADTDTKNRASSPISPLKPSDGSESPTTARPLDFDSDHDTEPKTIPTPTKLDTAPKPVPKDEAPPPKPRRPLSPREQAEATLKDAFPSIDASVIKAQPTAQPQSQLDADEMYARQLQEHYANTDQGQRRGSDRFNSNLPGSRPGRPGANPNPDDVPWRSFIDDDLPEIRDNIKKGFMETQSTINKWITNFKKRIDGEDDDVDFASHPAQPAQAYGNQSFGRHSSDSARRSADLQRYDADPQLIDDDFSKLELREADPAPIASSRPLAGVGRFKPASAIARKSPSPANGRKVSFQDGPPDEIGDMYSSGSLPPATSGTTKSSKWQPLSAADPSPVDNDPFSLGDSDDDKDAKPISLKDNDDGPEHDKKSSSEATAEAIAGGGKAEEAKK